MPAERRFRFLSQPVHAGYRAVLLGIATVIVLGISAAPCLATVGSVYYDGSSAAAGGELFNATFTGCCNVGIGDSVMPNLTSGEGNTALGRIALHADTTGDVNSATGSGALNANSTGSRNTADGWTALLRNGTGNDNVATGSAALANSNGSDNVATGSGALTSNTSGWRNVADGFNALLNATGSRNVALGSGAGQNLTSGSDNIDIANSGAAGESGTIRIGTAAKQTKAFLAGVYGKTVGGTSKAVVVNASGRLGTAPAPAAPLKGESQTLDRLRDKVHQQSVEIRNQQRTFTREIRRLREQMQNGG
jgi:hypothetical protein